MYLYRALLNATRRNSRMKKHLIPFKSISLSDKFSTFIMYSGLILYSFSVVYLFYSGVHTLNDISGKNIDK
jgi:hypothetical protein